MISLRPYQADIVDQTRAAMTSGFKSPLIVAPCGAGKTVMFSYFTKQAVSKGNKVLILAHRTELLDQIAETLRAFGVGYSFMAAGRHFQKDYPVQIGSTMSVVKRLNNFKPDICIVDEAHHCSLNSSWGKILKHYNTWTIGVTASPSRLSGEALGDVFDKLILGPSVDDLIKSGNLSSYRYFAPSSVDVSGIKKTMGDFNKSQIEELMDRASITGDAIAEYKKIMPGKTAVVFCVSIKHAEHVADEFNRHGVTAANIDSTMDSILRKQIVNDFKDRKIKILTNVSIVTEGFDVKALDGVIMLRPTQSLALYIQMVGRALRIHPGKEFAYIIDHVGNIERHGLPDEDRSWSLAGRQARMAMKKSEAAVKVCSFCFAAQLPGSSVCRHCNQLFEKKEREILQVDGELTEIDRERFKRKQQQGMSQTLDDLVALGKKRGYKRPHAWAKFVFNARQAKKIRGIG